MKNQENLNILSRRLIKIYHNTFVSVVVPVKNEEGYISYCIESLIKQDFPPNSYEIIVVDNGSTDNTLTILKQYTNVKNLSVHAYGGNTIASVRNFGAQKAKGEVIAFIDGDCIAPPNWLNLGCRLLFSDDLIGCVGFTAAIPELSATWVEKARFSISSTSKYTGIKNVEWLSTFNILVRAGLFREVGGFNETLVTCEDVELGHKIGKISRLLISDEIRVVHLDESKSIKQLFFKEYWRGINNLKEFYLASDKTKSMLSVFIPFFYICIPIIITTLLILFCLKNNLFWNSVLLLTSCVFVFVPMLHTIKKMSKWPGLKMFFQTSFISAIYLIARGLAVLSIGRKNG